MHNSINSLNWQQNRHGTWIARAGSLHCFVTRDGMYAYIKQCSTRRTLVATTITDHIAGFCWCKAQVQQRSKQRSVT